MTDFPTRRHTSTTSEISTLSYTLSLKEIPVSGGAFSYYISPELRLNIDSNLYFEVNWAYT